MTDTRFASDLVDSFRLENAASAICFGDSRHSAGDQGDARRRAAEHVQSLHRLRQGFVSSQAA